jgi:tRNA(Ile)-lysidine synthase
MKNLLEKIENNIVELGLIGKDDIILVGFSGGPDSTALLLLLHQIALKNNFGLGACYINHMIRPRAVKKEIEFCWKMCRKLKIDFHLINENIPTLARITGQSIETTAREFRRDILIQLAEEDGYTKIALGHHRDDIIETILFRMFRGTGPQGLDPIKPISGKFIRPLYNIEKSEIESFLKRKKVTPMIDKTNLESQYSRNYIRNKLVPVIEEHFGEKYKGSLLNLSKIISEENRYLAELAEKKFKKISYRTAGGKIVVDLAGLSEYDIWLRKRVVRISLEKLTGHIGEGSFGDIEQIEKIIGGSKKAVNISGGIRILADRSLLVFTAGTYSIKSHQVEIGKKIFVPELKGSIKTRIMPKKKNPDSVRNDGYKEFIDFDKISPPLSVRGLRPGDRFVPLGMKGSKKAGDFLTDRKISRYVRDEIPVLVDKQGIIWLIGHRIADRVKINGKTKRAIEIEYHGKRGVGSSKIRTALFSG